MLGGTVKRESRYLLLCLKIDSEDARWYIIEHSALAIEKGQNESPTPGTRCGNMVRCWRSKLSLLFWLYHIRVLTDPGLILRATLCDKNHIKNHCYLCV